MTSWLSTNYQMYVYMYVRKKETRYMSTRKIDADTTSTTCSRIWTCMYRPTCTQNRLPMFSMIHFKYYSSNRCECAKYARCAVHWAQYAFKLHCLELPITCGKTKNLIEEVKYRTKYCIVNELKKPERQWRSASSWHLATSNICHFVQLLVQFSGLYPGFKILCKIWCPGRDIK